MAFQDEADRLVSRLHISEVPRPLRVGVAALLCAALALAALGLAPLFNQGGFSLTTQPSEQLPGEAAAVEPAPSDTEGAAVPSAASAGATEAAGAAEAAPPEAVPAPQAPRLCVHVDGAVKAPGVYYLESGARIIDAVEEAGGFTKKAYSAAVNLAQPLEDGQQVLIPTLDEKAGTAPAGESSGSNTAPAPGSASSTAGKSASAGGLVNINQASAAELVTLSGIGEATAAKIIADREANGPFASVDDLTRVSGIGPKKLEALRDFICV